MFPEYKDRITQAFERLGADAVERGLGATGHSWINCFLACATDRIGFAEVQSFTCLGDSVINAVVHVWDADTDEFRRVAREWLELNRVPQRVSVCSPTS